MGQSGYRITDPFATYFLTFTVVGWVDLFTRQSCAQILLDSFSYCQQKKGLILNGYVILGSHLHLLARARENSEGLSAIIRDFKRHTSKMLIQWMNNNPKESRRDWLKVVFAYHGKFNPNNDVYQIWQQHNRPMICTTPKFTMQKLNYIHQNPVNAGIVDVAEDYRLSSARNYAGRKDCLLEVELLELGPTVGYIQM